MRQLIIEGKQTKKKERESTLQKGKKKNPVPQQNPDPQQLQQQYQSCRIFRKTPSSIQNHTAREKRRHHHRHHHHQHAAHAHQINTSKEKQTNKQSLAVEPETLSVRPFATIIGTARSPYG
jgi:hypothetical protein